MSQDKLDPTSDPNIDLTPISERENYPPLLNAVVPMMMLIASGAYAWSLRDVINPEENLLLLKPLFIAIWILLIVVLFNDVVPSIRRHSIWAATAPPPKSLRERFAPGTEGGAGLIVAATFAFAFFGPGSGPVQYVASAFIYLMIAGYLIGERKPLLLIGQAAIFSVGLYLIMGALLGVRL